MCQLFSIWTFSNSQWVPVKPFDMKQKSHKSLLFAKEQLNFTTAPKDNLKWLKGIWKGILFQNSNVCRILESQTSNFFQQSLRLVSTRKSVYFTSCCVRSRRRRVIRFATVVFLQNNPRKAPCRGIVKLVPLAHRWGPVKTVPTATAVVSLTTTTSCSTRPEFIQTTPK